MDGEREKKRKEGREGGRREGLMEEIRRNQLKEGRKKIKFPISLLL